MSTQDLLESFKPYYNWNTFNTDIKPTVPIYYAYVLNLIITGIPSILKEKWCEKHPETKF